MPTLGDLLFKVGVTGLSEFEAQMQGVGGAINASIRDADKAFSGFDKIGQRLSDIGGSLSIGFTAPLAGLAYAAVGAGADMEALSKGLTAVAGSGEEANRQLTQLREVAKLPGLGLKEAVEGSINLQALGFSADESQKILISFGNALATVGRGRDDLNEVIRQLGQLGARGQVTADNLRPIIERVPQVAAIIKREFGPEALSDPAKRFEALGVSSQDFINTLVRELSKLPPVTGGLKNDLENFQDTVSIALSRIGGALAPFVTQFVNVAAPAIESLANAFTSLPEPLQTATIAVAGITAAIGPFLLISGQMVSSVSSIAGAMTAAGDIFARFPALASAGSSALTLMGQGAILAAAAFAGFKLGEWAANNIPWVNKLSDALVNLMYKIPGVETAMNKLTGVTAAQASASENHAFILQKQEAALAKYGVTVSKAGKTQEQYEAAVSAAVKELASHSKAVDTNSTSLTRGNTIMTSAARAAADLAKAQKDAAAAATAASQSTSLHDQAIRAYQISLQQVQAKIRDLEDAERRGYDVSSQLAELRKSEKTLYEGLHPEILRYAEANRKASESLDDLIAKLPQLEVSAGSAVDKINSKIGDVADTFPKWKDAADKGADGISAASDKAGSAIQTKLGDKAKQVSTIFTDFSKGIVDDLFDGDFSIANSLDKLGRAFSRIFVEDAMSYVNTFVDKGLKYLMSNIDDLIAKIPGLGGLGSALGGIFGGGASAAGGAAGSVGSAAGGGAGTASSVGSAAASSAAQWVGAIGSAVSAVANVLSLFGVGQGGQKDRLNQISDATTFVAQMYGDRGLENTLKDQANNIANFVNGAFGGWYHDAYVGQLMTEEATQADIALMRAATDSIKGTMESARDALTMYLPTLNEIKTAIATARPSITISVTGYVGDRDALIAEIDRKLSQGLQLQGA